MAYTITPFDGEIVCCGGETPDVDGEGPQVTNFTPGGEMEPGDAIGFDVTDDNGLRRIMVVIRLPNGTQELMHDGDDFVEPYYSGTREDITDGYRYTVSRGGGWPKGTIKVRVFPVDTSGNEA